MSRYTPALLSRAVGRVIYYHYASYGTKCVSVVPLSIDINISWHAVHLHLLQVCESWFTAQTLPGLQGDHAAWMCACEKKKKTSTRNFGAIKHFWGLNYSTRLYSNQIYSALIIAHEHKQPAPAALPDLQNPYVRLCYVLVLNRSLRGQSFHLPLLTPVLLHHANQGGHEDKNRKRLLTILYPSPPSLCPNSSPSSLPEPFMSHPDPSVLFLFSCRG